MVEHPKWKVILSRMVRGRKLLAFDVQHCSPMTLRAIILDRRTPSALLDLIAQVYYDDEYLLRDLIRCPNLSETTLAFISLTASDEIKTFLCGTRVIDVVLGEGEAAPGEQQQKKKLNITQIVARMNPSQKIKLAMTGGKEARGLLVRESNKMVSLSVLQNPRITDGEIEAFAQSQNLNEDVMRKIAANSEWSKKYPIARALVNNPKTPPGVAMGFVNRLMDRDLEAIERSKNVSEAVRSAARGLLTKKKMGKKH